MKEIKKQLNLSINCLGNLYKVIYLGKVNMNLYVMFSLIVWMKQKVNYF